MTNTMPTQPALPFSSSARATQETYELLKLKMREMLFEKIGKLNKIITSRKGEYKSWKVEFCPSVPGGDSVYFDLGDKKIEYFSKDLDQIRITFLDEDLDAVNIDTKSVDYLALENLSFLNDRSTIALNNWDDDSPYGYWEITGDVNCDRIMDEFETCLDHVFSFVMHNTGYGFYNEIFPTKSPQFVLKK